MCIRDRPEEEDVSVFEVGYEGAVVEAFFVVDFKYREDVYKRQALAFRFFPG